VKRTPERNAELRRRREQRRLWDQRSRDGQCWNCGKSDWVDAVDNTGASYKGCAHCVVGPMPTAAPLTSAPERKKDGL
jgi:hypothetical protein